MRKPYVTYQADEIIISFIRLTAGHGTQEFMIGCELLFASDLALREMTLNKREINLMFRATAALEDRLSLVEKSRNTLVN